MNTSRRTFLATVAAAALSPRALAVTKPNSVFDGVRIGCITYSYRSMATTAEETLKALLEGGLSEVELMGGPIQLYAGISSGAGRKAKDTNAPPEDAPPPPTEA